MIVPSPFTSERKFATQVASPAMFAAIHAQGLVAIGGPVLPGALTSTALADLLRATPVAAVPVS